MKLNLGKKNLFVLLLIFIITLVSDCFAAVNVGLRSQQFTPPPIPLVNTDEFKKFVRTYHTFPSPFGYEPYRDGNGKEKSFLIKDLNPTNPYIPVTFYCNATICPNFIAFTNDSLLFKYPDGDNIILQDYGSYTPQSMIGFYLPNNPRLFSVVGGGDTSQVKRGDPIVTVLFSQRALQKLTQDTNLKGSFYTKNKNKSTTTFPVTGPLSDGNESINVGTTLILMGLGQASGVEFSETVSQKTGESFTTQVQTGFNLSVSFESNFMIGGGVIPASDSVKVGVNTTLSHMISNGLEIANERMMSRTYVIKPGINDTYYWAIYQLGYSYRMNAPLLDQVLSRIGSIWNNMITYKIADNYTTQDQKPIGNVLPPQAPNTITDVSVGVAVPINPANNERIFAEILSLKKPK